MNNLTLLSFVLVYKNIWICKYFYLHLYYISFLYIQIFGNSLPKDTILI